MSITIWLSIATAAFALVAIVSVAYAVARSNYAKATIELQSQNIQALFDKQKIQGNEIQDMKLHNAKLQGELDTFKSVPLVQIARNQEDTTKLIKVIADNQKLIMQELKITVRQDGEE